MTIVPYGKLVLLPLVLNERSRSNACFSAACKLVINEMESYNGFVFEEPIHSVKKLEGGLTCLTDIEERCFMWI
jgi:hypothetical protein